MPADQRFQWDDGGASNTPPPGGGRFQWEDEPPSTKSSAKQLPGFLDREIPLTPSASAIKSAHPFLSSLLEPEASSGPSGLPALSNATSSGLQSVARGLRGAVRGIGQTFNPIPQPGENALTATPIARIGRGIGTLAKEASQVPAAIHDINTSADPLGTYAKVTQETVGQGAGQALTALATEGLARRPFVRGLKAATKGPEPVYPGAPLPEHPGVFPGAPLPLRPSPELLQARGLTTGARVPPPEPSAGLGRLPVATAPIEPDEIIPPNPRTVIGRPTYPAGRNIGLQQGDVLPGGTVVRHPPIAALSPAKGLPQVAVPGETPIAPPLRSIPVQRPPVAELPKFHDPGLPEHPYANRPPVQIPRPVGTAAQELKDMAITRPVTENPVVGSFTRAMDQSGMPIAKRPNLLLKGSGRVNRILGPDEDLTGPLAKSVRQAKRQREQ